MKLRKLDITGFKSFADKTSVEFPAGISAIVGPNGCGKSNILDALRWAMGEQSVKQLRGKAMEDVIFAGTNGRPPVNIAEVSLVLSNDNGSAPEEFKDLTEIMVTRRLYRSGESVYLINKQPSRLKDIHNIFLGSGMGARSYSIIQQGNIGAITEATPEERRTFLEEAAGVTRYKSQKAETLRKLDATNQNLLRINDIIVEVERQMKSLNRQAKKAQIYKTYQERIRKLDILLSFLMFDELSRQIEQGLALLQSLKDADMTHSTQLRTLDAAIEEIKLARWQKNQKISELRTGKFETQRKIDRTENELSHLKKETERLRQESEELGAAKIGLEAKNQNMSGEITELDRLTAEFQKEVEQAKADIELDRSGSQAVRDQLAALNRELDERKALLMDLVAQEAKYKIPARMRSVTGKASNAD
ncbi:MAG: AAA family ATPase [Desulfobacteraceae bacterium]|nr:AAA family ATPase [Desulfobacteraceae bacterium]